MLAEVLIALVFTFGTLGAATYIILGDFYRQYISEAVDKETEKSLEKIHDYDETNDLTMRQLLAIFEYFRKRKMKKQLRQLDKRIERERSLKQPDSTLLNLLEDARELVCNEIDTDK